jgi:hypothetical protein
VFAGVEVYAVPARGEVFTQIAFELAVDPESGSPSLVMLIGAWDLRCQIARATKRLKTTTNEVCFGGKVRSFHRGTR